MSQPPRASYDRTLREHAMRIFMIAALCVVLGACTARIGGDDVAVRSKPIIVDVGPGSSNSGTFCPPGQAKKGRC